MRAQREYLICRELAAYLRLKYPKVIFHYDLAGLNLSKAQAGMAKVLQKGRGWPDLFIAEGRNRYKGCFIEIKKEGTRLYKKDGITPVTEHIKEQRQGMFDLMNAGFDCYWGIGLDSCIKIVDNYLNG
jgi:hypothetical protein